MARHDREESLEEQLAWLDAIKETEEVPVKVSSSAATDDSVASPYPQDPWASVPQHDTPPPPLFRAAVDSVYGAAPAEQAPEAKSEAGEWGDEDEPAFSAKPSFLDTPAKPSFLDTPAKPGFQDSAKPSFLDKPAPPDEPAVKDEPASPPASLGKAADDTFGAPLRPLPRPDDTDTYSMLPLPGKVKPPEDQTEENLPWPLPPEWARSSAASVPEEAQEDQAEQDTGPQQVIGRPAALRPEPVAETPPPAETPKRPLDEPRHIFEEPRRHFDEPRRPFGEQRPAETSPRAFDEPQRLPEMPQRAFDEPQRLGEGPQRAFDEPKRPAEAPQGAFDEPKRPADGTRRLFDEPRRSADGPPKPAFEEPERPVRESSDERAFDDEPAPPFGGAQRAYDQPARPLDEPQHAFGQLPPAFDEPQRPAAEPRHRQAPEFQRSAEPRHRPAPIPVFNAPPRPPVTGRPSADSLDPETLLRGRRNAPSKGWRRLVFKASGGWIKPGEPPEVRRRRELMTRARTPVAAGHHRVAVLSLKGGVGKTTTTVGLGATLAHMRGDRVIAIDANPDRGTLSDKLVLETSATVRDLLNEHQQVKRYVDIRAFTSQAPSRLEVLASDRDPSVSEAFSGADYQAVSQVLENFYSICITDCGTGLLHSAMGGVLGMADQIVLVSSPSVDGARAASATLDWLEAHHYGHLVRDATVVLCSVRPRSKSAVDIKKLEAHFAARCRAVIRVPYDPHLEEGAEIDLDRLQETTREAYLQLAAYVGDGFAGTQE
ncbi:MinD/ParA family ATP-binding protein [Nonomuraea glycinis]|uniref:MinD/ParA family ATP-binding protein n=1 Tax=Nonomuraea glycinis TaxID=2047744 RepID=UPI0033A86524